PVMDCGFCAEFANTTDQTRIIAEIDGWALLPTVGCFIPGYCLLMPIDHIDATADLAPLELDRLADLVEDMRTTVASAYGPTIVAEHGPRGCDLGASCCSHAHLHLIPVPDPDAVSGVYQATGGPGRRLARLADLAGGASGSYLYLSTYPGMHTVWPAGGFARQFVRRVCATLHGVGDTYDWREHPYQDNQQQTLTTLQRSFIAPVAGR
ncbi:MAG: hypothetical protein L0Y54_17770, partial [Sporichthyaceae bacterium]|nr:hypothetical protein [Sporichthyaceae bacterium]